MAGKRKNSVCAPCTPTKRRKVAESHSSPTHSSPTRNRSPLDKGTEGTFNDNGCKKCNFVLDGNDKQVDWHCMQSLLLCQQARCFKAPHNLKENYPHNCSRCGMSLSTIVFRGDNGVRACKQAIEKEDHKCAFALCKGCWNEGVERQKDSARKSGNASNFSPSSRRNRGRRGRL